MLICLSFTGQLEVDKMSRKVAKKMTELNVTREEYVFLKAMLLFNPGMINYMG